MKIKNKFIILGSITFLLCIIFLLPLPQRINIEFPALLYDNTDISYILSMQIWKLNYLFKTDEIIPEIKLYSENNLIFDNSSNKIKTTIYKFPSHNKVNNIEYISFYYYNSYKNKMDTANLWFDSDKSYFVFVTDNLTYIAPAKSKQDIDNIINYFRINNINLTVD